MFGRRLIVQIVKVAYSFGSIPIDFHYITRLRWTWRSSLHNLALEGNAHLCMVKTNELNTGLFGDETLFTSFCSLA